MEIAPVVQWIVQGVGLVFFIFAVLWLMGMLSLVLKWGQKKLEGLDAALAPFGRTDAGKAAYSLVDTLQKQVDEPDDAVIQAFLSLVGLVHKVLPVTDDMITADVVSQAFCSVAEGAKKLLDGVAQGEVPLPVPEAENPAAPAG